MAGEALTAIPTINLDDYEAGGSRRDAFTETTMRAFHDIGFVFLKAPSEVTDNLPAMYAAFEKLFDLPEDIKLGYEDKANHHQRGYTPLNYEIGIQCRAADQDSQDKPNHAENWFIGPEINHHNPLFNEYPSFYPPNVWPVEVPELKAAIKPVHDGLYRMGKFVLQALAEPLGKEPDFFEKMVIDSPTLFRPLHYPAVSKDSDIIGACQHTDINLVTALPAPTRDGLFVKTRAGEWIPGKTAAGHIIVQVGDMLQYLTGGYFLSAQHRVDAPIAQSPTDKGRYSSALFIHPASDKYLDVIPHLTPHPENYPALKAADFLLQRLQEIKLSHVETE